MTVLMFQMEQCWRQKKTVLTNASPCLVKLHLTHSQQDLFAQLCANIVMVLAVSAAPVFFSHCYYSAITKDLVRGGHFKSQ